MSETLTTKQIKNRLTKIRTCTEKASDAVLIYPDRYVWVVRAKMYHDQVLAAFTAQAGRSAELLAALREEGRMAVHWQCKHERDVADLKKQIKDLKEELQDYEQEYAT